MLGDGYSPLLLSGGAGDPSLSIDWQVMSVQTLRAIINCGAQGMVGYPISTVLPKWQKLSISYLHNKLALPGHPKFSPAVNRSGTESSCYTSLVPVGRCSAVVLYDLFDGADRMAFSLRLDFHQDVDGEIGIHC